MTKGLLLVRIALALLLFAASSHAAIGTIPTAPTGLRIAGGSLSFNRQLWVETTGDDSAGARNDPSRAFQTVAAAIAATLPGGDVINIGVGKFPTPPPGLIVSNGATLRGVNWSSTVLLFTNNHVVDGPNLKPHDNATIESLRIEIAERVEDNVSAPIGVHSSFDAFGFTNVTFRNVRAFGFTDGIIIVQENPCQASFYDCEFESSGDAKVIHGNPDSRLYFKGCNFLVHGPLYPATSVRLLNMSAGTVIYDRCSLIATNNGFDVTGLNLFGGKARLENSILQLGCTSGTVMDVRTYGSAMVEFVGSETTTNSTRIVSGIP